QRVRIVRRNAGLGIYRDTNLTEQLEVRGKAGHEVDASRFETLHPLVRLDRDALALDAPDARIPPRRDASFLDAILEIGEHPGLDLLVEGRPEVYECDARARAPQIERGLGRRVAATDDHHGLQKC